MTTTTVHTPPAQRPQSGPPLLLPAVAFAVLMVVSIVLSRSIPQPTASAADTLKYFHDHETAARVAGCLQFAAAMPLAIWTAVVYRRLRRLGVNAPGPGIALIGGTLASMSLALCGLFGWAASRVGNLGSASLARTLDDLVFATGGPGHVVPFGLLLAGVAVPLWRLQIGPTAFAWAGLVLAFIAVLGTLVLLNTSLGVFLPIGRFGGLIWLLAVSVILPRHRRRAADVA